MNYSSSLSSFDYQGTEDPTHMCAEEMATSDALTQTKRVLLDATNVPYVPTLFSTYNQPKEVRILHTRVVLLILIPVN